RQRRVELVERCAEAREDDLLFRRPARQVQQRLNLRRSGAADPIERGGDRGERPAVCPSGVVAQTGSQGGRPAAGLHLQERHPPAIRRRGGVVPVTNDGGEGVQDVHFLQGGSDDVGGGDAFGQLEIDVCARVADHHFA